MRTRLILIALGLFGVVLALTLGSRRGAPSERGLGEPPPSAAVEAEALELVPSGAERVAVETDEVDKVAPAALATSFAHGFDRAAVFGRVLVRGESTPIAGARLRAFERKADHDAEPLAETTSDEAGSFHLAGLEPWREYRVEVDADGYVRTERRLPVGREAEISLARGVRLAGRVLRAGDRRPVADADLLVRLRKQTSDDIAVARGRTSEDGAFAFDGLPADDEMAVQIALPGRLTEVKTVALEKEDRDDVEILLSEPRSLELQLVDLTTGEPLASLTGRCSGKGLRWKSDAECVSFATDTRGRFVLQWSPSARVFDVDRHTLADPDVLPLDLVADGFCMTKAVLDLTRPGVVVIPLTRGASVYGFVVDDSGAPVAGACVALERGSLAVQPSRTGADFPQGISFVEPPRPPVLCDDRGAYEIDAIAPRPGRTTVEASARGRLSTAVAVPGWIHAAGSSPEPRPSSSARVDLTLERTGAVRGHVLVDGEPILGRVSIVIGTARASSLTNELGEYHLRELLPGYATLAVGLEDGRRIGRSEVGTDEVRVLPGETVEHDIHIDGSQVGSAISGRVMSKAGVPQEGVDVYVVDPHRTGFTFGLNGHKRNPGPMTTTGPEGRFELAVPAGQSMVEVVALQLGIEVREEVEAGATGIELVLPAKGGLHLTVVDVETRVPVVRLRRFLWWRSGTPRSELASGSVAVIASANGVFECVLPEGTWDVQFDVPEYAMALVDGIRILADQTTELEVELSRGAMVDLEFYCDDGSPPPVSSVVVAESHDFDRFAAGDAVGWLWASMPGGVPIDANGQGRAKHLGIGTFVLATPPEGWTFDPERFEVPDQERRTVEVRCVPDN